MDQTAYFEQMRQKRRNEILDMAKDMIVREGLAEFSMQNLAKRLDVSTVTLYKYYKNNLAVFTDLYDTTTRQLGVFPEIFPTGDDILTDILHIVSLCMDDMLERREDFRLAITLGTYICTKEHPMDILSPDFMLPYLTKHVRPLLVQASEMGQIQQMTPDSGIELIAAITTSAIQNMVLRDERILQENKQIFAFSKQIALQMIRDNFQ